MTTCYLGRGIPGCTLWRRSNIKVNICRARMGDSKTLGLAEMEIKVNIVLNETQF